MANFQLLQNTRKETFFLKSVFAGVRRARLQSCSVREKEGVYVTIGHPAFYLFIYLTDLHFRGELQHGGDASQQKMMGSTNQNSRNRWCLIVRGTIWKGQFRETSLGPGVKTF